MTFLTLHINRIHTAKQHSWLSLFSSLPSIWHASERANGIIQYVYFLEIHQSVRVDLWINQSSVLYDYKFIKARNMLGEQTTDV